jgi:hypothetical protein
VPGLRADCQWRMLRRPLPARDRSEGAEVSGRTAGGCLSGRRVPTGPRSQRATAHARSAWDKRVTEAMAQSGAGRGRRLPQNRAAVRAIARLSSESVMRTQPHCASGGASLGRPRAERPRCRSSRTTRWRWPGSRQSRRRARLNTIKRLVVPCLSGEGRIDRRGPRQASAVLSFLVKTTSKVRRCLDRMFKDQSPPQRHTA